MCDFDDDQRPQTDDEAHEKIRNIAKKLREQFQYVMDEPIPQVILDLLDELDSATKKD